VNGLARRAAVLGTPIAHSLSPVIHSAGYAAAGLDGWSYTAIECAESQLGAVAEGFGPEWAGVSLTMPLKEVGLRIADEIDPLALALGATNTLVRTAGGWRALNTDAPGMLDALARVGVTAASEVAVLGGGGTARAALGAARGLGAHVTVYARRPAAIEALRPVAAALEVELTGADWSVARGCRDADVVISTVPRGAADHLATDGWRPTTVLFDVVYAPWPTPLAGAALAAGATIVSGLELLLAQALRQFELFTGVTPPAERMRQALAGASNASAGAMWIK
jgi:shikimate-5-dehydrogenase